MEGIGDACVSEPADDDVTRRTLLAAERTWPQTRGGANRAKWGKGDPNQPKVRAEFSTRPFARGSVGMARTTDPNSASSQFFVCLRPYPAWDGKYTVFGEVIQGLNNVQIISNVPADAKETVINLPVIKRAYLEKRQQ